MFVQTRAGGWTGSTPSARSAWQYSPGIFTGTGATEEIQFPQSLLHSRAVQDSESICHIRFPNSGSKNYTTNMMAGVSGRGWDSSLTVDQVF